MSGVDIMQSALLVLAFVLIAVQAALNLRAMRRNESRYTIHVEHPVAAVEIRKALREIESRGRLS